MGNVIYGLQKLLYCLSSKSLSILQQYLSCKVSHPPGKKEYSKENACRNELGIEVVPNITPTTPEVHLAIGHLKKRCFAISICLQNEQIGEQGHLQILILSVIKTAFLKSCHMNTLIFKGSFTSQIHLLFSPVMSFSNQRYIDLVEKIPLLFKDQEMMSLLRQSNITQLTTNQWQLIKKIPMNNTSERKIVKVSYIPDLDKWKIGWDIDHIERVHHQCYQARNEQCYPLRPKKDVISLSKFECI